MTAPNPPPSIGSVAPAKSKLSERLKAWGFENGYRFNKSNTEIIARTRLTMDAALFGWIIGEVEALEIPTLSTDGGVVERLTPIVEKLKAIYQRDMANYPVTKDIGDLIISLQSDIDAADMSKAREEGA